jgi:hypothetical protein
MNPAAGIRTNPNPYHDSRRHVPCRVKFASANCDYLILCAGAMTPGRLTHLFAQFHRGRDQNTENI